jgi:hypothetical protein
MYSLSICSGGDTDIPMIIPPTVKAEITDKITMPNTAPMLITLFMIIRLLRIHTVELTEYNLYNEKMIHSDKIVWQSKNIGCFEKTIRLGFIQSKKK